MNKANVNIVPISALPEINDASDFWIPASVGIEGDTPTSGRFSLKKLITRLEAIQLERRIPIVLVGDTFDYLNPEPTTLYKVVSKNISKLEYSTNNKVTWNNIAATGAINVVLPADTVVWFRVAKQTVDTRAYVTFSGRAKI